MFCRTFIDTRRRPDVTGLCSLFSQMLKLIPRTEFAQMVKSTAAERHARGFGSWEHLVAMLFCQFGRAGTLREICQGLASCEGKLSHLGVESVRRSTLAYANAHRPWQLFEGVFHGLHERLAGQLQLGRRKFRFKNKLKSLDASVIDLSLELYDWARFRRTKGAVKLHLVLDHDGYLPSFMVLTDGRRHDVKVAHELKFEPGTIVVMDRGYNDYRLFGRWCAQEVYFVTRMKRPSAYTVIERRPVNATGVIRDEIIRFDHYWEARHDCPYNLRRIEYVRPDTGELMVFLTNHLKLSAATVARVYKERWQIELFFKAIKQNLKIKTFVGTSPNAVRIQVFSALIAMLMLRFMQLRSRFGWSLSNLVALLRMNLFTHRDLWTWLDKPFGEQPMAPPTPLQAPLPFAQAI
jgi:hypothetical protein